MWYRKQYSSAAAAGALALLALLPGSRAQGATLDVCAACTHTTLDSAFAAALPGDTIILDGPTNIATAPFDYPLTTDLVVDAARDGVDIRGKTGVRPDKIRVIGTGAGPVITVEEGNTFAALGFTITGGSTGVLAMKDSTVDINRCLISGITGVGVDCVEPILVNVGDSVFTGCTGDAARIDMPTVLAPPSQLNILHSTFLTNSSVAVNAIDGLATVVACIIHDSGAGLAGTATTLEVAGNWVTDLAGAALPMPAGVVDPYPITDLLDPLVVFEQDPLLNPFPGDIQNAYALPRTGQAAATLTDREFGLRDFADVIRNLINVSPGADENDALATASPWITCYIIQQGEIRTWVGEGPATIEVTVENLDLTGALLWIANPTQSGVALGFTPDNSIGPLPIITPSVVDKSYGYVDYTIDRDIFITEFPNIADVDTTDYEIYIQPATVPLGDPAVLDGIEAVGSQAEAGRIFGFDTEPPVVVTDLNLLADQYVTAASLTDGGLIDPGPWALLPLLGQAGANAGYLNAPSGDPSIFFNNAGAAKPNMGIALTFTDSGSGFAVNGLPNPRVETTIGGKAAALYRDYVGVPGMAWWEPNSESTLELIASTASLTVTYANTGGTTLETSWNFTNLTHDLVNQWHAIANIRVMDLAGNEATLDPSFQTFIPLKPLHLWWFPDARGELRGGPSGGEETDPVFTWGMFRGGGGQDPKDPLPCFSTVRWRLWGAAAPGVPSTSWVDLTGGAWSVWMNPSVKAINLDTYFNATTRLRDLMTGPVQSEYLIAVQGYDEAGNLQAVPALGNLVSVDDLVVSGVDFRRWTDPGADESLALETRVQARYWYNPGVGARDRTLDGGDRDFGAATRIPLPRADLCQRIEAGFNITMDVPSDAPAGSTSVFYQVFEDGRLAASGRVSPVDAPAGQFHFVFPSDLMFGSGAVPAWLLPDDATTDDLFLNVVPNCSGGTPDRLGDDGPAGAEPPYRQRDVKYEVLFATAVETAPGVFISDKTPATVAFTVTSGSASSAASADDQPIKSFTR